MSQTLLLARFCTIVAVAVVSSGQAAPPAQELIRKGNIHYAKLQPTQALEFYLPAEKLEPENVDLLVRIARQYRHLMSDASKKEEKIKLGNTALRYAQRAVALAPNDAEANLAVAICHGKLLPLQGSKEQVTNSRIIKASADKVVALDPANDLGWQVLGRWYLNMADVSGFKRVLAQIAYGGLPEAKYEDAVQCFEKAIKLNPNRLMHYIELGRTHAEMGHEEEARKFINKGLTMPDTEKDDPETKDAGRKILAKLK